MRSKWSSCSSGNLVKHRIIGDPPHLGFWRIYRNLHRIRLAIIYLAEIDPDLGDERYGVFRFLVPTNRAKKRRSDRIW